MSNSKGVIRIWGPCRVKGKEEETLMEKSNDFWGR